MKGLRNSANLHVHVCALQMRQLTALFFFSNSEMIALSSFTLPSICWMNNISFCQVKDIILVVLTVSILRTFMKHKQVALCGIGLYVITCNGTSVILS